MRRQRVPGWQADSERVASRGVSDPLQPLLALSGVSAAAERAGEALARVHRLPANRHGWPATSAEAAVRAARASAGLAGGRVELSTQEVDEPILAGALRVGQALSGDSLARLAAVWRRAPGQVLARLHVLAAADVASDPAALGRPKDASGAERLQLLTQTVLATKVPAAVVAAVVHGELATLEPFGCADGVVARAAARVVAVSCGLDPHGLGVPEVYWWRRASIYRENVAAFAAGTAAGTREWLLSCCDALVDGAREATSIARQLG